MQTCYKASNVPLLKRNILDEGEKDAVNPSLLARLLLGISVSKSDILLLENKSKTQIKVMTEREESTLLARLVSLIRTVTRSWPPWSITTSPPISTTS